MQKSVYGQKWLDVNIVINGLLHSKKYFVIQVEKLLWDTYTSFGNHLKSIPLILPIFLSDL